MAKYQITSPEGQTFEIEAPDGATEDQVVAYAKSQFATQNKQPAMTANTGGQPKDNTDRNWYDPIMESVRGTGLELAQGALLNFGDEIAAGAASIPASLSTGRSLPDAYRGIKDEINANRDEYVTNNPKTALAANVVGGVMTGGAGLAKLGAKTAGMSVGKRMASNAGLGAGMGATAGVGAGEGLDDSVSKGVSGAMIGAPLSAVGGEVVRGVTNSSALKKEMANLLKKGSTDRKVAKYVLNGAGKASKDPLAKEAIKQGVDDGIVAALKGSSRADKIAMRKMISVLERGRENAREGVLNRPSDVIGKSLTKRIGTVAKENRSAGSRLDGVAEKLKGQSVNFDEATGTFMDDLSKMGVQLERADDGIIKPFFKGSDIEGVPGAERLIKRLVSRMQTNKVDAYEAHRLKRFIDEHVAYGKSAQGLTGKTEKIVKSLRHNIDKTLDSQFDDYRQVNDIYADTRGILDAIEDAAGSKIDITGQNADKALGTLSRSLLSNIRSRANLINAIDDLDAGAARYGGNFDDDVLTQVMFADELDRIFGASAKTSLQGDVQKAGERAVRSGFNLREAAADATVGTIRKMRGINEDNAIKALKKLLGNDIATAGKELAVP